jgi:hypothetical protein
MEETTLTLNIRQTGPYQYEVTIPEIGVTKTASTLDSALNITMNDMLKHLTTRSLILVFADQHVDRDGQSGDALERWHTDLEQQVAFEVARLGIAPQVKRRESHLVFELLRPLTRAQASWLDEHAGTLFDRYSFKEELEVRLDALLEEAQNNRKAAAHERTPTNPAHRLPAS